MRLHDNQWVLSLEAAGLEMGDIDRAPHTNPKGNRENRRIMALNDAVLADNQATWSDPPSLAVKWAAKRIAERDRLIGEYPSDRKWGFKEPRTLLVLQGWLDAIPDAQIVGSFRHPVAAARSLQERNQFPLEKGMELWLHYNRLLLDVCEKQYVPLISFDSSADDYQEQLNGILDFIGISQSEDTNSFFEPDLRRNSISESVALSPEFQSTYDALRARVV